MMSTIRPMSSSALLRTLLPRMVETSWSSSTVAGVPEEGLGGAAAGGAGAVAGGVCGPGCCARGGWGELVWWGGAGGRDAGGRDQGDRDGSGKYRTDTHQCFPPCTPTRNVNATAALGFRACHAR